MPAIKTRRGLRDPLAGTPLKPDKNTDIIGYFPLDRDSSFGKNGVLSVLKKSLENYSDALLGCTTVAFAPA